MRNVIAIGAFFAAATVVAGTASAGLELANNGGFEAGNTSGWESFPSATSTFNVTNDAAGGTFAAEVFNNFPASAAVVKQANLGVGIVQPNTEVTIRFSAKGEGVIGGVSFAEFFSEISGGGTSSSVILGGGPLNLTSSYQNYEFTTFTGADVSGGVTLQFAVVTGGDSGSVSLLFIDNVSVTTIPAPGAAALGLAGLLMVSRRRR